MDLLKDIHEGQAGVLGQLFVDQDLLEQRLLERLPAAAPQTLLPSGLGHHHPAQGGLRRRPETSTCGSEPVIHILTGGGYREKVGRLA